MAILKIDLDFETTLASVKKTGDGSKEPVSAGELNDFVAGNVGDLYVNLLIPHDGVLMELHAKKADMGKKGAIFELVPNGAGLTVRVKGTFKVSAYSHVAERVKASHGPIYVSGVYAGDWPPIGGDVPEYDKAGEKSGIVGNLV